MYGTGRGNERKMARLLGVGLQHHEMGGNLPGRMWRAGLIKW